MGDYFDYMELSFIKHNWKLNIVLEQAPSARSDFAQKKKKEKKEKKIEKKSYNDDFCFDAAAINLSTRIHDSRSASDI